MNHIRGRCIAALIWVLLFAVGGEYRPPSLAQGELSRAAMVVRLGSGQVLVRVVSFAGDSITGLELAERSGLTIVSWSNMVCKIGPQGCDNPSTYNECVCHCTAQSGGCDFWRYFHWQDGEWQFSGTGAAAHLVPAGGIEGWAWGDNAARPPEIDPLAIWDARRLAPGLARVTSSASGFQIQVDLQGDENHNAAAAARYRRLGGAWSSQPIPLVRENDLFGGQLPAALQPGAYEIGVTFSDPEGINGSASITDTVHILGTERLYLPMLLAPTGRSG